MEDQVAAKGKHSCCSLWFQLVHRQTGAHRRNRPWQARGDLGTGELS